jgi:hypothetical protein
MLQTAWSNDLNLYSASKVGTLDWNCQNYCTSGQIIRSLKDRIMFWARLRCFSFDVWWFCRIVLVKVLWNTSRSATHYFHSKGIADFFMFLSKWRTFNFLLCNNVSGLNKVIWFLDIFKWGGLMLFRNVDGSIILLFARSSHLISKLFLNRSGFNYVISFSDMNMRCNMISFWTVHGWFSVTLLFARDNRNKRGLKLNVSRCRAVILLTDRFSSQDQQGYGKLLTICSLYCSVTDQEMSVSWCSSARRNFLLAPFSYFQ